MRYYIDKVLPEVGADNLSFLVGNQQGDLSQNPALEIDSESHSICMICEHRDDCPMFGLSMFIEHRGAKITIDRCKSFRKRADTNE